MSKARRDLGNRPASHPPIRFRYRPRFQRYRLAALGNPIATAVGFPATPRTCFPVDSPQYAACEQGQAYIGFRLHGAMMGADSGMKAYALELRERVVAAVESGEMSQTAVARVFHVSRSWIKKLLRQKRELGHINPLPHGGGNSPIFDEEHLERLRQAVIERPDAALKELCERVRAADGSKVSLTTMWRMLDRLELSRKKKDALGSGAGRAGARPLLAAH